MRDVVMALILDVLKSDISLLEVFSWLQNANTQKLREIVKTDLDEARYSFPILLSAFIREKSSRILKWHNIAPEEQSTPKSKRDGSMPEVQDLSISSPIFNKRSTPNQETRKIRKIQPHRLDLHDDTAFPSLNQSPQTKETPKRRRINPTQLQELNSSPKQATHFGYSTKPSSPTVKNVFSTAKEQIGQKNLDHERALLKEKKQQLASLSVPDIGGNLPKSWSCLEPDISKVTFQTLLDRLVVLYAHCLTKNLLPSLYGEIKFLIELLLIRISPDRCSLLEPDQASMFDSVHNCVYFASKTIEKLGNIWCNVDRGFLHQLMINVRLAAFSSEWIQGDLVKLFSTTCERSPRPLKSISNVAFKTDTDNRFNFASDTSFQIFRKQRDLFCEIWQVWKANNSTPGWNTALGLRKMIQSLMDMKKDCINYVHLARLFRSQLLDVAQLVETQADEESEAFLSQLQSSDPDKLRRLKERLTNPSETNVSRNSSIGTPYKLAFEGDQEFFRDFIILASNPSFNEHLKNSLINGIEELVRSEDFDDDQERFADTVIALQVMAKFVAFLRFYPHMSEDHLPEHIFHHLSELRSTQKEPIDLLGHLSDAYIEGRLILTVPWIVTYFSLADPVSLCLPDCHPVLSCLVFIYRGVEFDPKNAFFVRLLLSWLFDQPNFPRSLLIKSEQELQAAFRTQISSDKKRARLDTCPLTTSNLVYQCCPFIVTWKHLLADFACLDAKSHTEKLALTRKITPISADESPSPTKTRTVKSLQCSLEENFFHNQPSSVKRTVDFVAERLASNIVRDIRHQIIPHLAQGAQATLRTWPRNTDRGKIEELSRDLCSSVRKEAASTANTAVSSVNATLAALLPNDLLPAVREVCVSITTKLTREKVLDWLNLHVTLGLFKGDLEMEWIKLEKAAKRNEAAAEVTVAKPPRPPVHDDNTWPPSMLTDQLKTLIRHIVRDEANVSRQDVAELLSRAEGSLLRRVDIMPAMFKCLQQLTFDFLFILCVFQPENVTSDAIVAWVDFWKQTYGTNGIPPTATDNGDEAAAPASVSNSPWLVFAPKHLLLLAQSTSARQSWAHVSTLLLQLLKSGLLRYEDVHEQAVAVLRQQWPQEVLARFASCVNDVVDWHRGQRRGSAAAPGDEKATVDDELLSWLSWFCAQEDLL